MTYIITSQNVSLWLRPVAAGCVPRRDYQSPWCWKASSQAKENTRTKKNRESEPRPTGYGHRHLHCKELNCWQWFAKTSTCCDHTDLKCLLPKYAFSKKLSLCAAVWFWAARICESAADIWQTPFSVTYHSIINIRKNIILLLGAKYKRKTKHVLSGQTGPTQPTIWRMSKVAWFACVDFWMISRTSI